MPNGINYELDFEKRIGSMADRPLLEFIARQTLEISGKVDKHSQRIVALENNNKRLAGIIGGITGTITAVIVGIINYFVNRG